MSIAQATVPVLIEEEMKSSYLDYAMSVIVSRALPDARDGLKPVHRRILHTMNELGLAPNKPYRKSAKTVGDVMGKYHPHGDAAIYDSLVRMAQDFSLRYPLIDGHGNFGSVDPDPPAAMRYTEARLSPLAMEMLEDLDQETVDFIPNYDNSEMEPVVLPACLPNLLVNGSSGIAVGMATNIPPHNLSEVVDGIIRVIDKPDTTVDQLMEHVKGPDFPTGGIILGREGISEAFRTGRGSVSIRGRTTVEEHKGRKAIVITEMPYQVSKNRLMEQIDEQVKSKRITGLSAIRDESDRRGMRIVIELHSSANEQVVFNQLFKHTNLQINFGIISLALVDGAPRILTLRGMVDEYLKHRQVVVTRRTKFQLKKARERAHLLEGYLIALDHLDAVIKTIRESQTVEEARNNLVSKFTLTETQAQGVLDLRLQRLTGLERTKIKEEHQDLLKTMKKLEGILASPAKILGVIREELLKLKEKFGDARKTEISSQRVETFNIEDLIPEEGMAVTVSHAGYIKRLSADTYRSQRRGGRGIMSQTLKEEDFLEHLFVASTHDYLLFFTNRGRVFRLKVHEIPEASRQARGTAVVNILEIQKEEKITALFPVKTFSGDSFLVMATKNGMVKKTPLVEYSNIFRTGIAALNLEEGDELIGVELSDGSHEVILGTRNGSAIRFSEAQVRPMGRRTKGVRGITLRDGDEVVAMDPIVQKEDLLVVTSKGFGKRSRVALYRVQGRRGKGIKTVKVTDKTGPVVALKAVSADDEVMVTTKNGILIRMNVSGISRMGRNAQGVRLIKVDPDDQVTALAHLAAEEDPEENGNGK